MQVRFPIKAIGPIIAVLVLVVILWPIIHPPHAEMHQIALKREFQLLQVPQGARVVVVDDKPKIGRVFLNSTYESQLSYDNLKQFYTSNLQRNGWHILRETPITDLGRNLGGREITFCKGPYEADLQFAGDKATFAWNYALSMSWNLHKYCE
jgi:hypothetical protein